MKYNVPKKIRTIVGSLACVISLACALASCAVPTMAENPGTPSLATVQISIGQDTADARTVLPTAPTFTKYVLSFTANGSQAAVADKEITGSSTEISLEAGPWTITAKGYASFNGADAEVASGSTTITAESGKNVSTAITISASMSGDSGNLGYTISAPQGIGVNYYTLSYNKYGTTTTQQPAWGYPDTSTAAFSKTGTVTLAPGYYVVTANVQTSNSSATKTEVVHVYANMSSNATFAFTAADFTPMVLLSGTLTATNNSVALSTQNWNINAYTNKADSNSNVGMAYLSTTTGEWQLSIPASSTEITIYLKIAGKDASGNVFTQWLPNTIQVSNTNISSIALTCDLSLITLSGTFNYKLNGSNQTLQYLSMQARTSLSDYTSTIAQGSYDSKTSAWTMTMPAFSADTPVYISINGQDSAGKYFSKDFSSPYIINSSSVSNISLEISKCTIAGTLSSSINGTAQDVTGWWVNAYSDQAMSTTIASVNISKSDGVWSMQIDAPTASTPIYFRVTNYGSGSSYVNEKISGSWDVTETGRTDIAITYDLMTLKGTLSAAIDGSTTDTTGWQIAISTDSTYAQYAGTGTIAADGTWSIQTKSSTTPTTYYFLLQTPSGSLYKISASNISASNASGIALTLGVTTVAVSGTVSGFTAATTVFTFLDKTDTASVTATLFGSGTVTNDSWSIKCDSTSFASKPVYFIVGCGSGSSLTYYMSKTPITIPSSGISNLELKASDFETWTP